MKRGVILEVNDQEAIVLTPDGQFRSFPKREHSHWQVGEEIILPHPEKAAVRHKKKWRVPAVAVVASFLLIFAGIFAYLTLGVDNTAVAYVNMDMNPSVEISVNKSLEVLSITGLNREGEELLSYLEDWSHESLGAVSLQIFQLAKDQGYIGGYHQVLVATSLIDEYQEMDYNQSIYTAMQEVEHDLKQSENFMAGLMDGSKEEEPEDMFYMHQVDVQPSVFQGAKEQGVSPGKYLLYLRAQEQGVDLDLEQVSRSSITSLDQQVGGLDTFLAPSFE